MANDYSEEIEEMLDFIRDYDLICYKTLSNYAYHYNRKWYNALHSPNVKRFIYEMFKGFRQHRKKAGTLPKYDPVFFLKEYEMLLEKISEKNIELIDWHIIY